MSLRTYFRKYWRPDEAALAFILGTVIGGTSNWACGDSSTETIGIITTDDPPQPPPSKDRIPA